jgi:tetratricopeptide (TPR) repeat protein
MTEVTLEQTSPKAKNLFNKGFGAFERGALEVAVDLLFQCVELEPGFVQGRRFLRAAEVQLSMRKKTNAIALKLTFLMSLPMYIKGTLLLKKGKTEEALALSEHLIRKDPFNHEFMGLFMESASAADMLNGAIQTLEIQKEQRGDDLVVLRLLGSAYRRAGNAKMAREVFERMDELSPNNPEIIKLMKDAMAMHSMKGDGWQEAQEKGTNYRDLIKDTKEAVVLEQQAKSVKSEKDVQALVTETLAKIEAEPKNLNFYRALARLYLQNKQFDEAIGTLTRAMEVSAGDPEIDAALSAARLQKLDYEIAQLKEAGNSEAVEAKEYEKLQFAFDDLQARVAHYPNDPKLRYEWGTMLFENEYVNEAIQQFQFSQKNLKYRVGSLYYLGLCFKQKGQYDLAKDQLEKALPDLLTMDDMKKAVCYELGEVWALLANHEKALEYYKLVYQADINYRDVTQKVESGYQK